MTGCLQLHQHDNHCETQWLSLSNAMKSLLPERLVCGIQVGMEAALVINKTRFVSRRRTRECGRLSALARGQERQYQKAGQEKSQGKLTCHNLTPKSSNDRDAADHLHRRINAPSNVHQLLRGSQIPTK